MPPARSVLDPSNGQLIDPRTGRPLRERAWYSDPIQIPRSRNVETLRLLQEHAEAAGVHLDLRPGTVGRSLVDGILNLQEESEIMVQRTYRALNIPYNPEVSMGAQVGSNGLAHGWEMRELPGEMVFNETALRQLERRRLQQQHDEDERIFRELDQIAVEGFNPPTITRRPEASVEPPLNPTSPGVEPPFTRTYLRRTHRVNPDPTFIEASYVTNPPDPLATIRATRVTTPEFVIEGEPRVRLEAIQARRFDLIDRMQPPMAPIAPPPPPPPPFDMEAHLRRPTAWEHLLQEDPF